LRKGSLSIERKTLQKKLNLGNISKNKGARGKKLGAPQGRIRGEHLGKIVLLEGSVKQVQSYSG